MRVNFLISILFLSKLAIGQLEKGVIIDMVICKLRLNWVMNQASQYKNQLKRVKDEGKKQMLERTVFFL